MSKIILLALLTVIILISGCTTEQTSNEIKTVELANSSITDQNQQPEDPCEGVSCRDTVMDCGDGLRVTCKNDCVDGECTKCEPSCDEIEIDRDNIENIGEDGVFCEISQKTCDDGFVAECENEFVGGSCTECVPECGDHDSDCEEDWACEEWSKCLSGKRTRSCFDDNDCGTTKEKPTESETCENTGLDHIIITEVYYDADGDDSVEEWIEIFNPTSSAHNLQIYKITDEEELWEFPSTIIDSGEYMVLARDQEGFEALYDCEPTFSGFNLRLSNKGDSINITINDVEVDFVAWEKGDWEIETDTGESLQRKSLDIDTDTVDDWQVNPTPDPNC